MIGFADDGAARRLRLACLAQQHHRRAIGLFFDESLGERRRTGVAFQIKHDQFRLMLAGQSPAARRIAGRDHLDAARRQGGAEHLLGFFERIDHQHATSCKQWAPRPWP